MGRTRKLGEKDWQHLWKNDISDYVLLLFLSLGSSWRQEFFLACFQEQ